MAEPEGGVRVTFADGVKDDVAELTTVVAGESPGHQSEVEALKLRIAALLVDCRANPYAGELMGPGLHPVLSDCRRIRFDIPGHTGKPRFRLIYRNVPSDGAPAECTWLAVGPRSGLNAHRKAQQRSASD